MSIPQRSRSSKAEPNSSTNCGSVVVPVTIERGEAVFAKAGNQRCSPLTLRCRTVQHFTANEVRSTYYRFARTIGTHIRSRWSLGLLLLPQDHNLQWLDT